MKRLGFLLILLVVGGWSEHARLAAARRLPMAKPLPRATRGGFAPFLSNNPCTDTAAPVAGQTWCIDSVTQQIYYYTGPTWTEVIGTTNLSSPSPIGAITSTVNTTRLTDRSNAPINVNAPPYLAAGDGVTDDAAAIQSAVEAACGTSTTNTPHPSIVRFPSTQSMTKYVMSHPLIIDCNNITLYGDDSRNTQLDLLPTVNGPTIIAQQTNADTLPYISNIPPCLTNHNYGAASECKDANGNLEYTTTGGMSSAMHPSWAVTPAVTTTDGTITWILEVVGPSLLTGTGSTFDGIGTTIKLFAGIDFDWVNNINTFLTGQRQLDVETTFLVPGSIKDGNLLASIPTDLQNYAGVPRFPAYRLGFSGIKLLCEMDIGGVSKTAAGTTMVTANHKHHGACTYDGSSLRAFLDGHLEATTPATGTIVRGLVEDAVFPAGTDTGTNIKAYFDGVRIRDTATYTRSFTPMTAKPPPNRNDLLALTFAPSPIAGIHANAAIYGTFSDNHTFYLPWNNDNLSGTSPGASPQRLTLRGLDLCPGGGGAQGGLFATWAVNARFYDLTCSFNKYIAFDFADNDYQIDVAHLSTFGGRISYELGNQSNDNMYYDIQCSGSHICTEQDGGNGTFIKTKFTDFGEAIHNFVCKQCGATFIDPQLDYEDSPRNFMDVFYSAGAWRPFNVIGLATSQPTATGSFFTHAGGAGFNVSGSSLAGGTPGHLIIEGGNPPGCYGEVSHFYDNNNLEAYGGVYSNVTGCLKIDKGAYSSGGLGGIYDGHVAAAAFAVSATTAPSVRMPNDSTTFAAASVTALSLKVPRGVVKGDLLIAYCTSMAAISVLSCPAGWTQFFNQTDNANAQAQELCQRIAGTEPTFYKFTASVPTSIACGMMDLISAKTIDAAVGTTQPTALSTMSMAPAPTESIDTLFAGGSSVCGFNIDPVASGVMHNATLVWHNGVTWAMSMVTYRPPSRTLPAQGNCGGFGLGIQFGVLPSTFSRISGTDVVAGATIGSMPGLLSRFPACTTTNEGRSATETNSTSACSRGTVATSAGTIHCQIYCNGASWIQTGL